MVTIIALVALLSVDSLKGPDASWFGVYEGEMSMMPAVAGYAPNPWVVFEVGDLGGGHLKWSMLYLDPDTRDTVSTKDYVLFRDSLRVDCYWLDEQNGLKIEEYFANGALQSCFELEAEYFSEKKGENVKSLQQICSFMRKEGDFIDYRVDLWSYDSGSEHELAFDGQVYRVRNRVLTSTQVVRLKKRL